MYLRSMSFDSRLPTSQAPGSSVVSREPFIVLVRHIALALALVRRDVESRYRGSLGGCLWILLTPLLLLGVYATVFGLILRAKWARTDTAAEFALVLYVGLLMFGVLQDCLSRAATSISSQPNLVRKVVFPLEILSWVNVLGSLVTFSSGLVVWTVFCLAVKGSLSPTMLALPLILFPVVMLALGVGWLFGALGVYLRDLQQTVGPISMALLFLTPIFYDLSLVPAEYQWLFILNPLTFVVAQARAVMLEGLWPDVAGLAIASAATYSFAWTALSFFHRARGDFSDAL
ncbi:MAG: ABC transporter permease [Phreatobacter sp.]|uniref:ABC transporter permease n=1 Tax=Phreatobacter sp. TaxID=1966341 RepID=UPI001A48C197|nr:ABC transporter permease [Phreatobacter sp.]MBL8571952.1 ABC transporter permease [Phreatobacter sp.]